MGVYVVRTSSLNDKHSCQLFRKSSSLVILSSSVSTAKRGEVEEKPKTGEGGR